MSNNYHKFLHVRLIHQIALLKYLFGMIVTVGLVILIMTYKLSDNSVFNNTILIIVAPIIIVTVLLYLQYLYINTRLIP